MNRLKTMAAVALAVLLAAPPEARAQAHVVGSEEMRAVLVDAARLRQNHTQTVLSTLSTPRAAMAMRAAQLDANAVKAAVATLTDEELARLAERSAKAQADFAAGRLSDRDLLWVLVGIAALILIIVAVR